MKRRHKRLQDWVTAGLLTESQAEAIDSYESARQAGSFGRRLSGLAITAILVGTLSMIAANWAGIAGEAKIFTHVILNLVVGAAAWQAGRRERDGWRDGLTLALFGLTLTLIALIGQVYQLDGTLAGALALWIVATFPFMALMARGVMTAGPWIAGVLAMLGALLADWVPTLPDAIQRYVHVLVPVLVPILMAGLGSQRWLVLHRPALATTLLRAGLVLVTLGSVASLVLWRLAFGGDDLSRHYLGPALAALGIGAALILSWRAKNPPAARTRAGELGLLFLAVSLLVQLVPPMVPSLGIVPVTASVFIAYWIFIGWIGQDLSQSRLVSLAVAMIAIRIYAIYLELFGTLLMTGLGLISGGIVLLVMVHLARRADRRFAKMREPIDAA